MDLIEFTDSEDIPGIILSMDFVKCFDRIEIPALVSSLKYFNIGSSYVRWTEMIYNSPVACVANNGFFTEYFNVTRSVKQGGPNSAYYFLVIAEVLAIELRKDPDLQGIAINEIMRILGQYADDMDLYLLGDEQNIRNALNKINKFGKCSGFQISYEKTTMLRIGSMKRAKASIYTKENIKSTTQSISVLGVKISTNRKENLKNNYQMIIESIPAILNSWGKRSLSLMGKVMIVNSLVASLFVYKMYVLDFLPKLYEKKIDEYIEKFLWNDKRPKITLAILQGNKEEGGLNLTNFSLKDKALKASWIQFLETDPYVEQFAYRALDYDMKENIWKVNINVEDIKMLFPQSFWRDVLSSWSEFNFEAGIELEKSEILSQIIWYNSNLRVKNSPFCFKRPLKNGLMYLNQLVNYEGGLLSCQNVCQMFELTTMQYNMITASLPKRWLSILKNYDGEEINIYHEKYENFKKKAKPVSFYYKNVNSEVSRMQKYWDKWKNVTKLETEYDVFCEQFKNIYLVTNNTKMRSFQYRLLHGALVFNSHLFRWKIKSNNLCTNCEEDKETYSHFFFDCKVAQRAWKWCVDIIIKLTNTEDNYVEDIVISKEKISLNTIHENPGNVANFICLATKMHLYSQKCMKKKITYQSLYMMIEKYKQFELYDARKNNKINVYVKKWGKLEPIQ